MTKRQDPIFEEYVHQPKIFKHMRINQGVQGVKELKSRMIDSTYSNAADPNSMRDLGMTRNAEYTYRIPTAGEHRPADKPEYSKYMVPRGKPTNNTFYSFGCKSTMMGSAQDSEVVSPQLLSNSKHLQTNTKHPVREFTAPQVQRVMDYTKNVSQSIFSPGCTQQEFYS